MYCSNISPTYEPIGIILSLFPFPITLINPILIFKSFKVRFNNSEIRIPVAYSNSTIHLFLELIASQTMIPSSISIISSWDKTIGNFLSLFGKVKLLMRFSFTIFSFTKKIYNIRKETSLREIELVQFVFDNSFK